MSCRFQINDPSLESQWRAIILFGKNSATYKFAFAKTLIELVEAEKTRISLQDLALPFARNTIEHLKKNDKQGSSQSSKFLDTCRQFIRGEISETSLYDTTQKTGFVYVIDAFQIVNGNQVPDEFYIKDFRPGKKEIVITDNLLKLKENFHFQNFEQEVEARWSLVETAWNLDINPNLLEVKHDLNNSLFFVETDKMRRVDITSVRDSLNGYQKGKCFYSFKNISINKNSEDVCQVDHFFPHAYKRIFEQNGVNINGVWNLVLSDSAINLQKGTQVPEVRFLERLYNRNEFYIESKHPLAETIVNQTGITAEKRRRFLQEQYNLALMSGLHKWKPSIELKGNF